MLSATFENCSIDQKTMNTDRNVRNNHIAKMFQAFSITTYKFYVRILCLSRCLFLVTRNCISEQPWDYISQRKALCLWFSVMEDSVIQKMEVNNSSFNENVGWFQSHNFRSNQSQLGISSEWLGWKSKNIHSGFNLNKKTTCCPRPC